VPNCEHNVSIIDLNNKSKR